MAHHLRLHGTDHFDVQRARHGIRRDVVLAAAPEGDRDNDARYRVFRRHAAQREAEPRAEVRWLKREGIRGLIRMADPEADGAARRAVERSSDLVRAKAAALQRQTDGIRATARDGTAVICANVPVTTCRNAA